MNADELAERVERFSAHKQISFPYQIHDQDQWYLDGETARFYTEMFELLRDLIADWKRLREENARLRNEIYGRS